MAPTNEQDKRIETFTAKEATICFLKELLKDIEMPEQIIIGEPGLRDETWKENFRRHIREIFGELRSNLQPVFFSEPFAVYQYYQNQILPKIEKSEIILIIDIGGGTFNSCVIKTTDEGYLARGGATKVPLGLQAELCGGSEIDRGLLEKVIYKAKQKGIRWKDDPMGRVESLKSPVLLHIEDAKIKLSEAIGTEARISEDQGDKSVYIKIERGMLHPEEEFEIELNGNDLKEVIRKKWRTEYGQILVKTINEATDKLKNLGFELNKIDRVLVAGGSSHLPFTKEEIYTVLPTLVDKNNIYLGPELGQSVALGIAYECIDQITRNPKLSVGGIAPCVLNDLYLGLKKDRKSPIELPKIRREGKILKKGQLFSAPFLTEDLILKYEFEMPFSPNDKIFYYFSDQPLMQNKEVIPLNLGNPVFSINSKNKIISKWGLELEIKRNGVILPTFICKEKGKGAIKKGIRIQCPEFLLPNFKLKEGSSYIGIDFGTSNSYFVNILSVPREFKGVEYPEFIINQNVLNKLRGLEVEIQKLKLSKILTQENILNYAKKQLLLTVFHSNKIEGNPLTKGETEEAINRNDIASLNKNQREAHNLQEAYEWTLQHLHSCVEEPEGYVRMLNKTILDGVDTGGGEYRKKAVKISGMDFTPPHSASVPAFMSRLAQEIKSGPQDRSLLEFAVSMHTKLVSIHPFTDANGRSARLLLNSLLMVNNLPPVIINYADKQRYLSNLSECNKGDISNLVDFMIECFNESLAELGNEFLAIEKIGALEAAHKILEAVYPVEEVSSDPILEAIQETGKLVPIDLLSKVMQAKVEKYNKLSEANYEAWQSNFRVMQSELIAIAEEFNSNEIYQKIGCRMKVNVYDIISFDKFLDIILGNKVSKTWFMSVEIITPDLREKLLFFFSRYLKEKWQKNISIPISLVATRYDGSSYRILHSEPISLRETIYSDGQLLFLCAGGRVIEGNVYETLRNMLAEVIETYL